MDIGSGQIFDVVGILFLMFTFLYHSVIYYKKLHSEKNNPHDRPTSGLKILQLQFNKKLHSEKNNPHDRPTSGLKILQLHCFISVYTYVSMFFAEGP